MSTGVTKTEIQSKVAKSATRNLHHEIPLPKSKMTVTLSYPGKISEADILSPINEPYVICAPRKKPKLTMIKSNGFVLSDNLLGLHRLLSDGVKVTLIYLDPPYGTGLDFQSRDLQHAYDDTMGDAAYVEFMRRRLVLLRELLADDGSIYLHIGHQMLAQLKLIMDEVFGEKNFRNLIVRKKCSSKNFTKNQYSNLNDYILFYSKSNRYKWNQPTIQPTQEWLNKEYKKKDQKGFYKLVPVHAPGIRRGETGKAWRGVPPPPGKHWQYQPSKLDELDAIGEIHWSKNGNPRRKIYLDVAKGMAMTDYWDQYRDAHHQSILVSGYPTEKNLEMLKTIVKASSDEGDLVLDPFCGSGTTLHAADDLGRQWIGIDQSFTAAKATLSRLTYGLTAMGDYVSKASPIPDLFDGQAEINKAPSRNASNFSFFVDAEIAEQFPVEIKELSTLLAS